MIREVAKYLTGHESDGHIAGPARDGTEPAEDAADLALDDPKALEPLEAVGGQ